MIEKLLRGWHGAISCHPGRKPLYRVSLMRTDGHWFEGEGQTMVVAVKRAIKAAGNSPKSKALCTRKGCAICDD